MAARLRIADEIAKLAHEVAEVVLACELTPIQYKSYLQMRCRELKSLTEK